MDESLSCLEEGDTDIDTEPTIYLLPPQNCKDLQTDEDSGDEDVCLVHNLLGSQLRDLGELSSRRNRNTGSTSLMNMKKLQKLLY